MNFSAAAKYLDSLEFRGMKLGLTRTRRLLRALGNPHRMFRSVHVGGSNGKGSTCAITANILVCAGLRTGLYTSPHLVSFRERMCISGRMIGKDRVARLFAEVRKVCESAKIDATYFEFLTGATFLYFAQEQVDMAVVEVGLGGRFDSTNTINPAVSIITGIALDHREQLGGTLKQIAAEKCGIIKKNRPLVIGERRPHIADLIESEAKAKNARVERIGRDFIARRIRPDHQGERFLLRGNGSAAERYSLNLSGRRQIDNAALAVTAAKVLQTQGVNISDDAIAEGLATVKIAARFEVVQQDGRTIVYDGAHNPAASAELCHSLTERYGPHSTNFVFGALRDKNYGQMLKNLRPAAKSFTFYSPVSIRSEDPKLLAAALSRRDIPTHIALSPEEVFALIADAPKGSLYCVTGSFYTLGELRRP